MPARPARVSRSPPAATARREISASPRVMSAASALWPETEAFHDAGGDRDHVLERAAEFHAGHVAARIQPQRAPDRNSSWTWRTAPSFPEATTTTVGSERASSRAKLGPESTATSSM